MAKQTKQSASRVRPLGDRVLVRRESEDQKKSPAGIIIPDTAQKEKSKIGVVAAVGPGRMGDDGKLVPVSVKAGERVVFNSGWDNEIDLDEEDVEYFLVKESDVLAVLK